MKRTNKTWQRTLFALGVALCLASAFLMVSGSIFGDRTTGIAIVISIVGIGLISTHRKATLTSFKLQSKTAVSNHTRR